MDPASSMAGAVAAPHNPHPSALGTAACPLPSLLTVLLSPLSSPSCSPSVHPVLLCPLSYPSCSTVSPVRPLPSLLSVIPSLLSTLLSPPLPALLTLSGHRRAQTEHPPTSAATLGCHGPKFRVRTRVRGRDLGTRHVPFVARVPCRRLSRPVRIWGVESR